MQAIPDIHTRVLQLSNYSNNVRLVSLTLICYDSPACLN